LVPWGLCKWFELRSGLPKQRSPEWKIRAEPGKTFFKSPCGLPKAVAKKSSRRYLIAPRRRGCLSLAWGWQTRKIRVHGKASAIVN